MSSKGRKSNIPEKVTSESDTDGLPSPPTTPANPIATGTKGKITQRQNTATGNKPKQVTSESDSEGLPSLEYVRVFRSPPPRPATPVASTSACTKRPITQRQKSFTGRKNKKQKKGAGNGAGHSSLRV